MRTMVPCSGRLSGSKVAMSSTGESTKNNATRWCGVLATRSRVPAQGLIDNDRQHLSWKNGRLCTGMM